MHRRKSRRLLSGILALLVMLSISPVQTASAITLNPLGPNYEITAYPDWPSGMPMNYSLFGGGVFDGHDIWMIPVETDRVVKISPETGEMTGYSDWPSGYTKRNGAFSGGVFDGQHIWMIPSLADRVIKIDPDTGEMTGYNDWPAGFQSQNAAFSSGVFDGTYIWLIPVNANQIIRIDPVTGEMTGYDEWPDGFRKENYAFNEGVFDGTFIWMIPSMADRVIKLNPATGEMTGYSDWPAGYDGTGYSFGGAVFDGNSIWMLPYSANQIVKLDTATEEMTGYDQWPSGFDKSRNLFRGGAFDGEHIWTKPSSDARILKIDPASGDITGFNQWPDGFNGENKSFSDAVYDGNSVWFIPSNVDRVIRLTSVPELSAVTGGDGQATISWQPVYGATGYHVYQSLSPGGSGTEIAAVSGAESSHTETGLSNGVTYYYTVKAVYAWGESAASNEMSVTPMSSNADLSGLSLSQGTLSPSPFDPATTAYTASVGHGVSSVTVTSTVSDSGATLSVSVYDSAGTRTYGPESLTSGAESLSLPLSVGSNRIEVTVTAPSSMEKTYIATVTREASSNADLSGLALSEGTLSPSPFDPVTTAYTASVGHGVSSVTVTPTVTDSGATLSVSVHDSAGTRTYGPETLTS
ncbi:cadherin-like beta sandwich domain-containing protein, partial [Paenibacillus sp. NPDC057967]|uniref:cadherin-like beta sandwich domain-containing protein n=1 Tax=Paenibacillus sp. NPDC057967 TaxID=3346293 RepID=UPI0036D8F052